MIPCEFHQSLTVIYTNLAVALRIFNSDERIYHEKFATLCSDTHELIIDTFPWASITPTLHKVLGHSAHLIEDYNGGRGLKSLSEEGLEACHKHIRRYREQLARKFSFETNIQYIFIRLTSQSDYFSFYQRKRIGRKIAKKYPKVISKKHELFDSMIII